MCQLLLTSSNTGFVFRNHDVDFIKHYGGREDIPEQCRVLPPPPERGPDMDTLSQRIAGNDDVSALLNLMEANNMPGAKDLLATVNQVSQMEKHLANMVQELGAMRKELAEAQKLNHPIQTVLRKAVTVLQGQALGIRDNLSALKRDISIGCKAALDAVGEKGLSALRNIADFIKIRPALESLQKEIDTAIRQDERAIANVEKASAEYHETGRHIKNMGRAIIGKEAIQQAKPMGALGKTITAPIRADRACCMAMRGCVGKAIDAVNRLEKAERKPPIKETLERHSKEIAQAERNAPTLQRPAPEHAGR